MISLYFSNKYNDFFERYEKKIINCWTNIVETWTEKDFEDSIKKWDDVQKNIVNKKSGIFSSNVCKTCNIEWNDKSWIRREHIILKNIFWINCVDFIHVLDICPNCDCCIEPFLSNPINKEYILRYIPQIYHRYILPLQYHSYEIGFDDGKNYGLTKVVTNSINFKTAIHLTSKLDNYAYTQGFKDGIELFCKRNEHNERIYNNRKRLMEELKCVLINYFGTTHSDEESTLNSPNRPCSPESLEDISIIDEEWLIV